MKLIDTHAHIYAEEFNADRPAMLEKSLEVGVQQIFMPNVDHTSIDGMLELEQKYPGRCVAMMGLHPCYVKKDFERELYLVESWLAKRPFAAVGEVGTDLYWDKTFWAQQQEAFQIQVRWSVQYGRPLVIHCRESINETIELLKPYAGSARGIFHCFSGDAAQAKTIIDMGFYLGIGGVATFKNGGLDKVLPEIGLDKLVLETDSPYLAPVPHRGKRNEPAYLALVAKRVADILRIDMNEVAEVTSANAEKIFALPG